MAKVMQLRAVVPAKSDIVELWHKIKSIEGAYLVSERPPYVVGFVGDEATGEEVVKILREIPNCEMTSPTHNL